MSFAHKIQFVSFFFQFHWLKKKCFLQICRKFIKDGEGPVIFYFPDYFWHYKHVSKYKFLEVIKNDYKTQT